MVPVGSPSTPASSGAALPRVGLAKRYVNRSFVTTWDHQVLVPTWSEVPSAWTTRASRRCRQISSITPEASSTSAASVAREATKPVDTGAPKREDSASAVRSTGRCWRWRR